MGDDAQRQLDTRAIEIASETRGKVESFRNLFTAVMSRIDSNEQWQRAHQAECHAERKDAREARENLRLQMQGSFRTVHGRLNGGLVLLVMLLIAIIGVLLRDKLGL